MHLTTCGNKSCHVLFVSEYVLLHVVADKLIVYSIIANRLNHVASINKLHLLSCCSIMPKKGPGPFQWKTKLRAFANGSYKFGKGKKAQ